MKLSRVDQYGRIVRLAEARKTFASVADQIKPELHVGEAMGQLMESMAKIAEANGKPVVAEDVQIAMEHLASKGFNVDGSPEYFQANIDAIDEALKTAGILGDAAQWGAKQVGRGANWLQNAPGKAVQTVKDTVKDWAGKAVQAPGQLLQGVQDWSQNVQNNAVQKAQQQAQQSLQQARASFATVKDLLEGKQDNLDAVTLRQFATTMAALAQAAAAYAKSSQTSPNAPAATGKQAPATSTPTTDMQSEIGQAAESKKNMVRTAGFGADIAAPFQRAVDVGKGAWEGMKGGMQSGALEASKKKAVVVLQELYRQLGEQNPDLSDEIQGIIAKLTPKAPLEPSPEARAEGQRAKGDEAFRADTKEWAARQPRAQTSGRKGTITRVAGFTAVAVNQNPNLAKNPNLARLVESLYSIINPTTDEHIVSIKTREVLSNVIQGLLNGDLSVLKTLTRVASDPSVAKNPELQAKYKTATDLANAAVKSAQPGFMQRQQGAPGAPAAASPAAQQPASPAAQQPASPAAQQPAAPAAQQPAAPAAQQPAAPGTPAAAPAPAAQQPAAQQPAAPGTPAQQPKKFPWARK
jgi:hypothetical protein